MAAILTGIVEEYRRCGGAGARTVSPVADGVLRNWLRELRVGS